MRNRYVIRARISEKAFRRFLRHVAADLTAVQVAALTGLNRNTINRLLAASSVRMAEACEAQSPFCGTVEVDESYFGPRRVRGKAGRGAGRKTPVFGIFKRGGRVYTELVPDRSKAVLSRAIRGKVSLDAVVCSDGWRGYDGLVDLGYKRHLRVDHGSRRVRRAAGPGEPHQRDRGVLGVRQEPPGPVPRDAPAHVLLPPEGVRVPVQPPPRQPVPCAPEAVPPTPARLIMTLFRLACVSLVPHHVFKAANRKPGALGTTYSDVVHELNTTQHACGICKMLRRELGSRLLRTVRHDADLVVIGGGMAGVCCALTAARAGAKVIIAQDRPVLGGNASSEVRLWVLGATCHMRSNNRWAREGGVVNEILLENLWRNREGNALLFDTVLLEMVEREPNITLLLNTAAYELSSTPDQRISDVKAFCSQNSTMYELHAPLFCDASGDGIIGFMAGAAFRMGAEKASEFDEPFAPTDEFGHLLGHSIYFYAKDTGKPVKYVPPSYALKDVPGRIPRYRDINPKRYGPNLWWIEWGGRLDTIHETETIKWELWKVVYGIWDYVKNSGAFPEAENMTLEWVGQIPGKRESRRFEGPYMLSQRDVVHRPHHEDAVAFGGWSIDLHPADGVFSEKAGCYHLHSKGIYQVPLRCFYSTNIPNLFLAGRIISATHVAFGSTRVMGTCAHGGQAVGMAAALCTRWACLPGELASDPHRVRELQRELLRTGQHIPGYHLHDPLDIAREARVSASSRLLLTKLPPDGPLWKLDQSVAQVLPVDKGQLPTISLQFDVEADTEIVAELRTSSSPSHHTPDVVLERITTQVGAGRAIMLQLDFKAAIDRPRYVFVCLMRNPLVSIRCSEQRVTGLVAVSHLRDEKTSSIGGEDYEVWVPGRRPGGHNLAFELSRGIDMFGEANLTNGLQRPTCQPNAWVAALEDSTPRVTLEWDKPRTIAKAEIFFDVDYDYSMESVLWEQPESVIPFCVKHYRLYDDRGSVIAETTDNHQARNVIVLAEPVCTNRLVLEVLAMQGGPTYPATVFEVRCYE